LLRHCYYCLSSNTVGAKNQYYSGSDAKHCIIEASLGKACRLLITPFIKHVSEHNSNKSEIECLLLKKKQNKKNMGNALNDQD